MITFKIVVYLAITILGIAWARRREQKERRGMVGEIVDRPWDELVKNRERR